MQKNNITSKEIKEIQEMKKKRYSLNDILENDPLDLLGIDKSKNKPKTENDKLIESFEEINRYYDEYGKKPEKNRNLSERRLAARLEGIKSDFGKTEFLRQNDRHNLLGPPPKAESIEDIFNNDFLGILDDDEGESLFDIKHISTKEERESADFVAKRKPCKNFEDYESKFIKVQNEIASGKRSIRKFEENNVKEGNYFILKGILLYVEKIFTDKAEQSFKTGNRVREDGRTRCIFENGTESNMLFRSLVKTLYLDGKTITNTIDQINKNFFSEVNAEDKDTGYIYVLKSKSTNPKINSITNLYKIGYSINKVEDRVKNAEREATYLMAPVKIIASWKCYNLNTQIFERMIHDFFSSVCLDIEIANSNGQIVKPREWFTLPFSIIEEVIGLIISGNISKHRYDKDLEAIVKI
ncbi:MAG: GIY-YIG nuclease family protein [Fusobacterium sp.]